jgi:hypothetical protein
MTYPPYLVYVAGSNPIAEVLRVGMRSVREVGVSRGNGEDRYGGSCVPACGRRHTSAIPQKWPVFYQRGHLSVKVYQERAGFPYCCEPALLRKDVKDVVARFAQSTRTRPRSVPVRCRLLDIRVSLCGPLHDRVVAVSDERADGIDAESGGLSYPWRAFSQGDL